MCSWDCHYFMLTWQRCPQCGRCRGPSASSQEKRSSFFFPMALPETERSLKARKVRSCCTSILLYPAAYPVVSMTDKTPPQPSNLLGQPTQSTQYNWYGGIQRPSKWLLNNVMASTSSATEVQLLEIWDLEAQQRQQRKRVEEDGRGKESPCCQDVPRCAKMYQEPSVQGNAVTLGGGRPPLERRKDEKRMSLLCLIDLDRRIEYNSNNFMVP